LKRRSSSSFCFCTKYTSESAAPTPEMTICQFSPASCVVETRVAITTTTLRKPACRNRACFIRTPTIRPPAGLTTWRFSGGAERRPLQARVRLDHLLLLRLFVRHCELLDPRVQL